MKKEAKELEKEGKEGLKKAEKETKKGIAKAEEVGKEGLAKASEYEKKAEKKGKEYLKKGEVRGCDLSLDRVSELINRRFRPSFRKQKMQWHLIGRRPRMSSFVQVLLEV